MYVWKNARRKDLYEMTSTIKTCKSWFHAGKKTSMIDSIHSFTVGFLPRLVLEYRVHDPSKQIFNARDSWDYIGRNNEQWTNNIHRFVRRRQDLMQFEISRKMRWCRPISAMARIARIAVEVPQWDCEEIGRAVKNFAIPVDGSDRLVFGFRLHLQRRQLRHVLDWCWVLS